MLLFVVWLAMAWRVAGQCDASTAPSCRSQTCCGGSGGAPNPQCEWVIEQQCDPRQICHVNRKRLLANLTEIFGISTEQAERDILETEFPLPDSLAHLAHAIAVERKRILNGYCACNEFSCCYQGCIPQSWSSWSACSVTCGSGSRSRSLAYHPPVCGGSPCDATTETEMCYPGACPTNCQVSSWSGWTCSTTCGHGTETRSRYITVPEANGGSCPEAGSLAESRDCDPGCCPSNCVVGGWSTWSGCSVGCGGGSQSRSRSITSASCGGSCSESETLQMQPCNTGCCPSNCVIGAWSNWSGCSVGCGGGSQSRSRSITPESCGGSCSTSVVNESQNCNTGCCPQHCQVNNWSQWSACSQVCGGGTRSRNRAITVVSACGGNACPSDLSETENCGGSCCAVNCVLNPWSSWSSCSATCGGGTRSRSRTKSSAESCGGTCDVLNESEPCSTGCCPSNCVWAAFGAWSGCSVTCGMGTQTRSRTVQTAETCGGSCPGGTSDSQTCMQPACALPPVDCEVSQWAAWSSCTATCGASATKTRNRMATRAAANGGVPCPALSETTSCGLGCCPVACAVSAWASWSTCSATCGSGMRSRSRTATTDAACGGTPCPTLSDSETCSAAACAADCQLSMWSNWSACSQACGTGEIRRTRSVVAAPANGGAACGALSESQPCMQAACACAVSAWSNWSPCSVTCGGGTTSRSRNVTMSASDCPPLSDSKACSTQPCARDCVLSAWATWSACSVTCGGGRRERTRTVTQAAVEPGMACPLDLTESEQCGAQVCTAPGLACSEYTACTDCTDSGKTSPRRCQFCGQAGSLGMCQSMHIVEGNSSSGLNACPIGLDTRSTTIAACAQLESPGGTGTTTTVQEVIETVDVRSALKLGANETTALADVTLSNGVRLQVRVVGEEGAMLRALEDGGVGAFSPSRDGTHANNATNMQGRLRAGLSMEFLFAKDRPVSFKRLVLGAWDAVDEGQLEIGNDKNADGSAPPTRRRDIGAVVMIRDAESSFEAETMAGYTKYVLSANGQSEFSVKSFMFTVRGVNFAQTAAPTVTESVAQIDAPMLGGFVFDTLTIALIAVGGALCLIIIVVVVVVLARRKSSEAQPDNRSAVQSNIGITSGIGMEMRPALSRVESSLVVSDTAPPAFATVTSMASDDQYLPLAIQPLPNNQYQSPRGPNSYHAPGGAPSAERYGAAGGSGLIAAINSSASYESLPLSTPPGQAHVGHYRGVPSQPQERLYNSVEAAPDNGTFDVSGSAYMPLPQQPIM